MKKLLIFLPVMFIVTLVFPNNISLFNHTQSVQKEIHFSIFSGSDYHSAAYNDAKASVEVTVSKVNGDKAIVIGKKSFSALELSKFPSSANAISDTLLISDTIESNEVLMVTYTITYNTNGSIIQFQNKEIINRETGKDNLNVTI